MMRLNVYTGERPPTLNAERSAHWAVKHQHVVAWKTAAHEALMRVGYRPRQHAMAAARIEFRPLFPINTRGVLPDTGGCYPAEKAIVDGLVEAGVIPDDNQWHNAGQLTLPPVRDPALDHPVIEVTLVPSAVPAEHIECSCRTSYEMKQARADMARNRK